MPLAVGPPALSPMVEMDIRGLNLTLAICTLNNGDEFEVKLVPNCNFAVPVASSSAPTAEAANTDWLNSIANADDVFRGYETKTIFPNLISQYLAPFSSILSKQFLAFVETEEDRESNTVIVKEMEFDIAKATHLICNFEDLHLTKDDEIQFFNQSGEVLAAVRDGKLTLPHATDQPQVPSVTTPSSKKSVYKTNNLLYSVTSENPDLNQFSFSTFSYDIGPEAFDVIYLASHQNSEAKESNERHGPNNFNFSSEIGLSGMYFSLRTFTCPDGEDRLLLTVEVAEQQTVGGATVVENITEKILPRELEGLVHLPKDCILTLQPLPRDQDVFMVVRIFTPTSSTNAVETVVETVQPVNGIVSVGKDLVTPRVKVESSVSNLWSETNTVGFQSTSTESSKTVKASKPYVGARVVRGPAWAYGKEDGGAGNIGAIIEVKDWKNILETGVVVKWENDTKTGFEGFYRFNHQGLFDVILCDEVIGTTDVVVNKPSFFLQEGSVLRIDGNYIKIKVTLATVNAKMSESESGSSAAAVSVDQVLPGRTVQFSVNPIFPMKVLLEDERFADLRANIESAYFPNHYSSLTALVKYLNSKGTKKDVFFQKSWNDFAPKPEDLVRSAALKELVEAEVVVLNTEKVSRNDKKAANAEEEQFEDVDDDASIVSLRRMEYVENETPIFDEYAENDEDDEDDLASIFSDDDLNELPPMEEVIISCTKCQKPCSEKHYHSRWTCDWPGHQGANSFGPSTVYGCDTFTSCNWWMCPKCWIRTNSEAEATSCAELPVIKIRRKKGKGTSSQKQLKIKPVEAQFGVIQALNKSLGNAIPLIDLHQTDPMPGSLPYYISKYRGLILSSLKEELFNAALESTRGTGGQFDLFLSRSRARKHAAFGKPDVDGNWSVFGQAFRVMHPMAPQSFRRNDRLYVTKFMGEHAQDAGGPYRESFDTYCQELQSNVLSLFVRSPNGLSAVGLNREKWIFNPAAASKTELEMFTFLGKLMGVAIRSKEYLGLNIPGIIW
jgi:hypothetical protein